MLVFSVIVIWQHAPESSVDTTSTAEELDREEDCENLLVAALKSDNF
jgi:hypothetical protein